MCMCVAVAAHLVSLVCVYAHDCTFMYMNVGMYMHMYIHMDMYMCMYVDVGA